MVCASAKAKRKLKTKSRLFLKLKELVVLIYGNFFLFKRASKEC
jgi:hypothetical protein